MTTDAYLEEQTRLATEKRRFAAFIIAVLAMVMAGVGMVTHNAYGIGFAIVVAIASNTLVSR